MASSSSKNFTGSSYDDNNFEKCLNKKNQKTEQYSLFPVDVTIEKKANAYIEYMKTRQNMTLYCPIGYCKDKITLKYKYPGTDEVTVSFYRQSVNIADKKRKKNDIVGHEEQKEEIVIMLTCFVHVEDRIHPRLLHVNSKDYEVGSIKRYLEGIKYLKTNVCGHDFGVFNWTTHDGEIGGVGEFQ